MQLRLPHHFEETWWMILFLTMMRGRLLTYQEWQEGPTLVASSWQEYHPLCLFQTDAEELKLLDGPVARHHRRQQHNQWNRYI